LSILIKHILLQEAAWDVEIAGRRVKDEITTGKHEVHFECFDENEQVTVKMLMWV
jgi:hypothetical protein